MGSDWRTSRVKASADGTDRRFRDSPEAEERKAAFARGQLRNEQHRANAPRDYSDVQHVAISAFPILADSVRDYAVFLMDPEGIIMLGGS